jgi:uncharacterized protein
MSIRTFCAANLAAFVGLVAAAPATGQVAISQIYGGGGNTSAQYQSDFIEVFNRGSTSVDLTGFSVQYAATTGTTWSVTPLSGSLAPGQYFLVQESTGSSCAGTPCGVPLPTPDATGTIFMSATSGKIALVGATTALTGSCPSSPTILDLVGYGATANCFEGASPAPGLSNTTAALRAGGGCTDTNANSVDFTAGAPMPRNTASTANPCAGDSAPSVPATSPSDGATGVAVDSNISITFSEPVDVAGAWFAISCASSGSHSAAVSGGPTTFTLNPDADFANSEGCTVTVEADNVTDQDAADPPNNMSADYAFAFTTAALVDDAPAVTSTSPADGATGVAVNANVSITFSEPVSVAPDTPFTISCTTSGGHAFTRSGGPTTFTLDPTTNFVDSETCTVSVDDAGITDQDAADPPNNMAADYSFSFSTVTPIPIGLVQGAVSDTTDGATHLSPRVGETVVVRGVIYQKTLARTSTGGFQHGFHLQNTAETDDDDPLSSDGIFVFMGSFTTLIGGYAPQVGDEVVISGRVTEFFALTQLSSASLVRHVDEGVALDLAVPAFAADPPDESEDAERYWERREGMRARVPAGSIVVDSRDVFGSTFDAEVWVIRADEATALRADPFARRVFRDPHPLDNRPELFDDGNGYRFMLASLGLKANAAGTTEERSRVMIAPARTYDTVTNSPVGGVYFSFAKYGIQVGEQPTLLPGIDPSTNAAPTAPPRPQEYSIADYNVENLYDYRDDPFDGCDFVGNTGCPGVNPPFDYVPGSEAAYNAHVAEIAQQIVSDLHAPEILLLQEAEDQDICTVSGSSLTCGTTNNADGKPDTLQEVALAIAARGGPQYDAAYDRDGADDRGIVSGFLYRTDRVQLLPAPPGDAVLGSSPTVSYRGAPLAYNTQVQNPKVLNAVRPADVDTSTGVDGPNVFTRPPQVGLFRIWELPGRTGNSFDLYAISNHFSSTPDARVGQRREQAAYNAAIAAAIQGARPGMRIAIGGDFNVYPRPDDPFPAGHPRHPSDQLGPLYAQGLVNLWDVLVAEVPVSAYSYIFQGQTQTLDQHFVSPSLRSELQQFRMAHVNADWPADHPGDGARGASDHDPGVARFAAPQALAGMALTKAASTDQTVQGSVISYTITARNAGPSTATNVTLTDEIPAGVTFLGAQASQGSCSGSTTITCNLGTLASGASAQVVIDVRADQAGTITNTASTRAAQADPSESDNRASATTTVLAAPLAPPPQCRLSVSPKKLFAGRRGVVRVLVEDLAARRPLADREVRLRGAGINRSARTGDAGTVRFGVRPRRPGILRVTVPEFPGCGARISVRQRVRSGIGPGLTGRIP